MYKSKNFRPLLLSSFPEFNLLFWWIWNEVYFNIQLVCSFHTPTHILKLLLSAEVTSCFGSYKLSENLISNVKQCWMLINKNLISYRDFTLNTIFIQIVGPFSSIFQIALITKHIVISSLRPLATGQHSQIMLALETIASYNKIICWTNK